MGLDYNSVLVDNDFINHIIETRLDKTIIAEKLEEALLFLCLSAFMHPLVYENELLEKFKTSPIFADNVVIKASFFDIHLDDPSRKQYYVMMVKDLYYSLFGEILDFSDDEVFTKWLRMKSLGEIHSLSTCLLCGCKMFLSDDKDSKILHSIIVNKCMGAVEVVNRTEFFDLYSSKGGKRISRSERRQLVHSIQK